VSAGIDAGCVRLKLAVANGKLAEAMVASDRPAVAQVLRGRPADDAIRLLPMLFALCGRAQGRAAVLALDAARGVECPLHLDAAIGQEVMREHLWRWLLDLPPLLGKAPLQTEFVTAAGCIAGGRRGDLLTMLGDPRIEAMCRRLNEAEDITASRRTLLPGLSARDSLAHWPQLDAGFCRTPHWQGQAAETGALARRQAVSGPAAGAFAARWLARLEELREWAGGMERVGAGGTASAVPAGGQRGRALVETARGLLMHEIVLDGGRIADYFIVAPTEWNFHPQGPLPDWLNGYDAGERQAVETFAARAVAALDPCVRWELEWL
jgi:hypothetical protein